MIRFFHPQMIAQCANKPGPTIDQMIDFCLAGARAAQGELSVIHRLTSPSFRGEAKHPTAMAWIALAHHPE